MIATVAGLIAAGTSAAYGVAKLAFWIKERRRRARRQKELDAIELAKARSGK
jgi:hypothetical protein